MQAARAYTPFRWRRGLGNLAFVIVLMTAASFVPADTSLSQVRKSGLLRVCVPTARLPLVTGDAARPGFDAELLEAVARRMGLRPSLRTVAAMGSDFNPRNWGLHRGMCDLIAGGVVDSRETRNFLQTVPTGAATGWAIVAPAGAGPAPGEPVAVLTRPGLDRLALSRFLRASGLEPALVRDAGEIAAALASGAARAGITDRATAERIAAQSPGLAVTWPEAKGLAPRSFAIGAWKGDLALRRAVARHIEALERDGTLPGLRARYGLAEAPTTPMNWQ